MSFFDEVKQSVNQLCENSGDEVELIQRLQNVPADVTSCPIDLLQQMARVIAHYRGLHGQVTDLTGKVEKQNKSSAELETKTKEAKSWEKAHQAVLKERDRLQSDLNKMILCKDRLEQLCRELQREKKKMEDECSSRIRGEEAKRKEFAEKVNDSINQLKQQISSNQEQQQQLCEENLQLTDKLEKSLEITKHHEKALEKYEEREKTFHQLIAAKDEERKILSSKYDNACQLMQEIHKAEIEKFKVHIDELLAQRKSIEESFVEQAKSYDQKFQQMSVLVTESQATITKYKKEMGEITKFIQKLHGESVKSKETIHNLSMEKAQFAQAAESMKKKVKTLENLCRRLQSDRRVLVSICKGHDLSEEVEKQLANVENEASFDGVEEQSATMVKSTSSVSSDHETENAKPSPIVESDKQVLLQVSDSVIDNATESGLKEANGKVEDLVQQICVTSINTDA